MIIENLFQEKERINKIIVEAVKEILYKGLRIQEKSLGSLEDDVGLMLRAFQLKNKIYDYAVFITHNGLVNRFEMKLIYSLIDTEKMEAKEAEKFEVELDFNF